MLNYIVALIYFVFIFFVPQIKLIVALSHFQKPAKSYFPTNQYEKIIFEKNKINIKSIQETLEKGAITSCYSAWRGEDVNASFEAVSIMPGESNNPWDSVFPAGTDLWQPLTEAAIGFDFSDYANLVNHISSIKIQELDLNATIEKELSLRCYYIKPDLLSLRYNALLDENQSQPKYISDPCAISDFISCSWE